MKNKLVLFLSFVTLFVTGCANSSHPSISNSEDLSSNVSEEESNDSISEEPKDFCVKFYVNTEIFTTWNPRPSGYFIHAWGETAIFDTWGNKTMNLVQGNLYCATYQIPRGQVLTGVVFAFKQGDEIKQTIDMECHIEEEGNYAIQYNGSQWIEVQKDVWKMSASIVPYN